SALNGTTIPVAPICVKPWLLPNIDPTNAANPIFDRATGAISNPTLLGWTPPTQNTRLRPRCTNCSVPPLPTPTSWRFYTGNPASFPSPTQALPTCAPAMTTSYEKSIAGCIETPIACNSVVTIDNSNYFNRNTETANAVNCLTHANANQGDQVDPMVTSPPFQFLAGNDNPITGLAGSDVMVSD